MVWTALGRQIVNVDDFVSALDASSRLAYVTYGGSDVLQRRDEAKQKGAVNATNRPDELFRLVMDAIGRNP
jgi:hypothetical protein